MTVYQDKRTGSWCYRFKKNNILYHRCFKGATKSEVAQYETVAKSELIKSTYDIASENKSCSLEQAIQDYEKYAQNHYATPEYPIKILHSFMAVIGNKLMSQITVSDIEKYRTKRKKDKIKNSTINREINNIRSCFVLAKKNNKVKYNVFTDVSKLEEENVNKRYLSKEEEEKLLAVCNPTMKAIVILALQSGMRKSEILDLKWSDVYLEQNYLTVLNPKNGRERDIIITEDIKRELLNINRLSDYVFTNPLTKEKYTDITKTFARAVKKAEIPHISFHELRHSTASRMNELGIDTPTIQEYLDHQSITTTMKYIHKPKKNIVDAIERLSKY